MPNIDLSSGRVHYQEAGQGVPLLLLHANPGDSRDFSAVMPALAAQYHVLALDWPGNGQSPTPQPPGSATALYYYNVLHEFIAALKLPPALFVGNSLGGNAAARLAIEQPQAVKGLVLVSPGGFTPHNFITRSFCRFQGSRFAIPPKFFARLYLKHRSPTVVEMLARAATEQATPERLAVNHAVWRSFIDPEHDLRKSASAIRAPTLLLFGQYDPVIPAKKDGRAAAQAIPGSRLVVPPSGHAPFAEMPDVFLAEVLPFLAQCSVR